MIRKSLMQSFLRRRFFSQATRDGLKEDVKQLRENLSKWKLQAKSRIRIGYDDFKLVSIPGKVFGIYLIGIPPSYLLFTYDIYQEFSEGKQCRPCAIFHAALAGGLISFFWPYAIHTKYCH
jgi:hypothetical protein